MSEYNTHTQMVANPQPQYKGPEYCERFGGGEVQVDTGMHALLQTLWAKGFQTQYSCQGNLPGTEDAKRYGTTGYILFRTIDQAIEFFATTYNTAADRNIKTPNLTLETAVGLSEDGYLSEDIPVRGTIRFQSTDLTTLESLWVTK